MECLNTLIGKVFEKVLDFTVVPVGRHLGYVLFYSSNIQELKKEAKKLKATRNDVECLVEAARNNNEVIKETVHNWMGSANEITEQAERFFEREIDANTTCSYRSCPSLLLRYKLSKEANKMATEVGELNIDTHLMLLECIGPSSAVKEAFESRVSTMNEIMEALADPAVHAIGLYGLGGVGKTTLAKQVARKAQDGKLFDKVLLVEVKRSPIKEIQSQIAGMLGLRFEVQCESELIRATQLRQRLQQEKSLLIVLDDLWESLDFQQVGIPFAGEASTQCRFIFTSMNVDLLSHGMNCKRNIMVEILSAEEAWALFKEMAVIDELSDHLDLVLKAKEVCQKCVQLPLVIVAVARALRNNKRLADWKDALQQLNSYASLELHSAVYSSIRLCYTCLKRKELKSTFLLSAMISQDPSIMELLMYAVGLGLLEGVPNMEAARDRLDALVHQLKDSSLLLDSYSEDRYTIHDVVRDVALSIASEEQHALLMRRGKIYVWPIKYILESCTAICLDQCDIDGLPAELCGPKVEFFYLNSEDPKLNIPSNFFNGMKEVKVLSLSNLTFLSLPPSISLLNKLITLSLDSCELKDIALAGHLKQLQILNLSNSRITQLPCEVGQLYCLKILNLSCCYQLEVIPPNILSNLKKLEELYMGDSFNRWEAEGLHEGKERASLDELKHLQKLSALEIDIPNASVLPKDLFLENLLNRYKICIGSYDRFYDCEFSKALILGANNNLNMEYGDFKLFESVEDLTLEGFNGIASLYQSHNTVRTFCKLQAIKVSNCDQLKSLFLVSLVRKLPRLERIEVSACKALEEIVGFVEENVEKGSARDVIEFPELNFLELNYLPSLTGFCLNKKVEFPNLETLILTSINRQNIWDIFTSKSCGTQSHITAQTFCNLQIIEVSYCDHLKSLFSISMIKVLPKLEKIEVSACKSLEEIVAFVDKDNVENDSAMNIIEFLQLRTLELNDLPALTRFCFNNKVVFPNLETLSLGSVNCHNIWDISAGIGTQILEIVLNDPLPDRSFSNLKILKVEKCDFLLKLIPFHCLKSLSNLEGLEIRNCASLEVVFNFGEFNNYEEAHTFPLKTLHLSDLPELKTVWSKGSQTIVNFQSLQKLVIENCYRLEIFTAVGEKVALLNLATLSLASINVQNIWDVLTLKSNGIQISETVGSSLMRIGSNDTLSNSSFSNLRTLKMEKCDSLKLIPLYILKSPSNLEALEIRSCVSLEEVFNFGESHVYPLKKLLLYNLPKLHTVGGRGSFKNLVDLDVSCCDQLVNLLTFSTVKTLMQLTSLSIKKCKEIKEIIIGDEDVEDTTVFRELKILILHQLPCCRSFCYHNHTFNFPLLDEVIIQKCPRFIMFCRGILVTPLLQGVKVETGEVYWHENLNKTIQRLFYRKGSLFHATELKIDEHPELIDIWNGKVAIPYNSFSNLTDLVVDKCGFLSSHVIPSYVLPSLINLVSLQVRNCDSVDVIFDLESIDIDKESHTLQAIRLRYLTLEHLPNLKYVWNKDPCTIDCFQHLWSVSAYQCESLRSIFPTSMAKGLATLKSLSIESCGVEAIVAEDHTPSPTIHFVFPELRCLDLIKLPNLINFCPQRHTVDCPKLYCMNVSQCKKVKVFSWEDPRITEKDVKDELDNHYPFFLFEKVVPKLTSLVLNQNHVKMLRNGQFQVDLFHGVLYLGLDSFDDDESLVFPCTFLEKFPELKCLTVGHSSFKEIFSCQGSCSDPSKKLPLFTSLTLTHLDQLQNIWNKDSQLHPALQNLTRLDVIHCSELTNLTPSSASFDNLSWLTVIGCHGLGYLFTSSTAKTFVCLVTLVIEDCKMMEKIVTNEGNVEDKIVLKKLKCMKLVDLPILKSFCCQTSTFEFPSLKDVTVSGCPKMKLSKNPSDIITNGSGSRRE